MSGTLTGYSIQAWPEVGARLINKLNWAYYCVGRPMVDVLMDRNPRYTVTAADFYGKPITVARYVRDAIEAAMDSLGQPYSTGTYDDPDGYYDIKWHYTGYYVTESEGTTGVSLAWAKAQTGYVRRESLQIADQWDLLDDMLDLLGYCTATNIVGSDGAMFGYLSENGNPPSNTVWSDTYTVVDAAPATYAQYYDDNIGTPRFEGALDPFESDYTLGRFAWTARWQQSYNLDMPPPESDGCNFLGTIKVDLKYLDEALLVDPIEGQAMNYYTTPDMFTGTLTKSLLTYRKLCEGLAYDGEGELVDNKWDGANLVRDLEWTVKTSEYNEETLETEYVELAGGLLQNLDDETSTLDLGDTWPLLGEVDARSLWVFIADSDESPTNSPFDVPTDWLNDYTPSTFIGTNYAELEPRFFQIWWTTPVYST